MKRRVDIIIVTIMFIMVLGCCVIDSFSNGISILAIDSLDKEYSHLKTINTIKCALWKDKSGFHYFAIEHIELGVLGNRGYSSKISAYSQKFAEPGKWSETWRIKDFSPNELSSIGYLDNTFKIIDIDNDSIAEICFMYTIFSDCCDAWVTKLILHRKGEKLAIRGKIPIVNEDLDSYSKEFDPAFDKVDEKIKKYASEQWDIGVRNNWKGIISDFSIDKILNLQEIAKDTIEKQEPPPKKESPKDRNGQHILQQRKESHNRSTGGD